MSQTGRQIWFLCVRGFCGVRSIWTRALPLVKYAYGGKTDHGFGGLVGVAQQL